MTVNFNVYILTALLCLFSGFVLADPGEQGVCSIGGAFLKSSAQQDACVDQANNQSELLYFSDNKLPVLDRALERVYSQLLHQHAGDPEFSAQLTDSKIAWAEFVNQQQAVFTLLAKEKQDNPRISITDFNERYRRMAISARIIDMKFLMEEVPVAEEKPVAKCVAEDPVSTAKRMWEIYNGSSGQAGVPDDPVLADLLRMDEECQLSGEGGICALDYDPWVSSNGGPETSTPRFSLTAMTGDHARVALSYKSWFAEDGSDKVDSTTILDLKKDLASGCWFSEDITGPDNSSLKRVLVDYHCLPDTHSETLIAQCTMPTLSAAEVELGRVYDVVQARHQNIDTFMPALDQSRTAWLKLRDAQLAMVKPQVRDTYRQRLYKVQAIYLKQSPLI